MRTKLGLVPRVVLLLSLVVATLSVGPLVGVRAQPVGDTVSVWVTTPDRTKLLEQQPNTNFAPDAGSNPYTIDVDPTVTYQTMDGFGSSFSDSSAWLVMNKMSAAQRNDLMTKLFDPVDGIGLSFIRQPISASDFARFNYTYDDMPAGQTDPGLTNFSINHDLADIIPVLQQAKALNPDLKIMGTPWSAPAWMKSNDAMAGGSLNASAYADYAQFFVKYIQAYQTHGLTIDFITPQNEPLLEVAYPSMILNQAGAIDFIGNHLGPAFQSASINTKIVVWDFNWDNTSYAINVLQDPTAGPYIAGSAWHCYGGNVSAQGTVHDAVPSKDLWFTECSSGMWSPSFGVNLKSDVRGLIIGATRQWAKSVVKWNIVLDESYGPTNNGCQNCTGVAQLNQSNGGYTLTHEYYSLGHASKFVKPGAMRIESNTHGSNAVDNVAFKNLDGSRALIAVNTSTVARTFKVREDGESFEYTLPAGAVGTFLWPSVLTPGPTPPPTPTPAPVNLPFGGTPWPLPGTIQAENYDTGGEGIGYHDRGAGNNGGQHRSDDVDIEASDGGFSVGWTDPGEWLKFTVDVAATGTYDLTVRVANGGGNGILNFELDGIDISGAVPVPNTGGWGTFQSITRHNIPLTAGSHTLRLIFAHGTPGNINHFTFAAATPPPVGGYSGTPAPIPGRIELEKFDTGGAGVAYVDSDPGNNGTAFRLDEDVDIEGTIDLGISGFNVGWTTAGEWLRYSVTVADAGTYHVAARVASSGVGGTFHLEVDGIDETGPVNVPTTGGWNVWQSVDLPDVNLTAGAHTLKLVMDSDGPVTNSVANMNWIEFFQGTPTPTPTIPPSTPYTGTPAPIPGTIQIEEYDQGGETIAYHDTTAANEGNQFGNTFRTTEGVDTEACADTGGGHNTGFSFPSEWMKYTVNVTATSTYTIGVRVATLGGGNPGGTFHIEFDGVDVTGPMQVPNTNGWQNWTTVTKPGVNLTAGAHVVKLALDSQVSTSFGNFNWMSFTDSATPTPTPTRAPFGGTPAPIPGVVQIEDFDHGGEGLAYHDDDPANNSGQYRTDEGVDIEASSDTGGGYNIGWTSAGEWLTYSVNVVTAADYTIEARVAALGGGAPGGTFHLEIDDVDVTGPMQIPDTGGWQNWQTISVNGVALTAGAHILRLELDAGGTSAFGNLNYLQFVQEIPPSLPDFDNKAPDLHGDGKADILWRNSSSGLVYLWQMNGGTTTSQGTIATVADANWKAVATGDFNADGRSDIVWKNYSTGQVYIWMMNGLSYTPNLVATVPLVWDILGAGDTDGDGKADLVWRHGVTGAVYVWKMNGAAIGPTLPVSTLADMQWGLVAVRDYNADGKSDLLWRHRGTGQVAVWLLNGAAILGSGVTGNISLDWSVVAGGDLTGDGKSDIVWRHRTTGQLYLWTMNGVASTAQNPISTVGDMNWKVVGSGRYDSDNKFDLLWRNSSTGQVFIWLMNGATPVSFLSAGSVPDPNWGVQALK